MYLAGGGGGGGVIAFSPALLARFTHTQWQRARDHTKAYHTVALLPYAKDSHLLGMEAVLLYDAGKAWDKAITPCVTSQMHGTHTYAYTVKHAYTTQMKV